MAKEEYENALESIFDIAMFYGDDVDMNKAIRYKKILQQLINKHFEAREKIMKALIERLTDEWGYEGLDEEIKQIFNELWKEDKEVK